MSLLSIPLLGHFVRGRRGCEVGKFGWSRVRYDWWITGVVFGCAAVANLSVFLSSLKEQMRSFPGDWFLLVVLIIHFLFTYEICAHFCYWLGFQVGIQTQKRVISPVNRRKKPRVRRS
jgi:hypothetical protein